MYMCIRIMLNNTYIHIPHCMQKLRADDGTLYDPPSYAIDDFVSNQPSDLLCMRCNRIPRKPLRLKCCNTLYCEPCSMAVTTCPTHQLVTNYKSDTILRGRISKLTVRCANGCESKCAVYQMKEHLLFCKGTVCVIVVCTPLI